jgi:HK97 family phage major capsid protein
MEGENKELELIVQKVNEQVKKFGDDVKTSYEEMRQNHNKLKEIVDRNHEDQYDKNFIDKLAADVSTRQEEMDKQSKEVQEQIKKRMDELEAAFNRPGLPGSEAEKEEKKAFEECRISILASNKDAVVKDNDLKDFSIEQFRQYKGALVHYLKSPQSINGLTPEEQKVLSVGVDPHGGYTVTPAMNMRIIQKIFEMDPIRTLANVETITGPYMEWFVDWNEADCGWETETVAGDETSTPDIGKMRIDAHTMYARPKITQMLIEDSGINPEEWLSNKVAEKFARTEEAAFVTGDGRGKPRGFLTYDASTTDDERKKIKQVAMGAAASLTADGFIDVMYSLVEYYLNSPNLAWLMQRSTVAAAMKLKYGDGTYIWKPGLTTDQQSTILGATVRMSPTMPTIAASSLSVALADWKEAYTIVDRLGITVQRDPYTKKPYVEYYTRKRTGGDVTNPQAIKIGKISA